ncbi:SGNH/GDSL hydrolase family protein [Microbulbifer pacificus]|uniref:SGNH/GDSL hydrolase family protein n=1 Tax=Microbulbifer pacificus TaxID=407164 RepID=A0AAU0MW86_9GAMM|nr:SGNH/GDSL hydrolase family protein [Microbulbifer pacificus]WOX04734.1 SGNH/GDSL hydrolase family protein [Microbulbifer pacificus]
MYKSSLFVSLAITSALWSVNTMAAPAKGAAAGDSITMGFAADCTGNTFFTGGFFCLLGGDQPEHSWFDGSASNVNSVHDKYKALDPSVAANKNAARSGAEMRGGGDSFSVQADRILADTLVADHVEVVLGGNDICNRDCVDPANCSDPLLTEGQWRGAVQAGLDKLVNGLPTGSTVVLGSVPRVQDLRAAGIAKQTGNWRVNCESVWSTFGICRIATNGGTMNGESFATRYAGIEVAQQRYNQVLQEEAAAYNGMNGVEVIAEYTGANQTNVGTFTFGKDDIDGGDCFHPSVRGQNTVANLMWSGNPDK